MKIKASQLFPLTEKRSSESDLYARKGNAFLSQAVTDTREKKAQSFSSLLSHTKNSAEKSEPTTLKTLRDSDDANRGEQEPDSALLSDISEEREALAEAPLIGPARAPFGASAVVFATEIKEINLRPFFPPSDVELIVNSVQTQMGIEGQKEVTLEFSKAVYEGLSVKLSSDLSGGVMIEFMATTVQVQSEIQLRLPTLRDELQAHGVDGSYIGVSLTNDGAQQQGGYQQRPSKQRELDGGSDFTTSNQLAPRYEQAEGSSRLEEHLNPPSTATYLA